MPIPAEPLTHKRLQARVWIAAGSRDGDRAANLAAALTLLAGRGIEIRRVSSLYETEPVDLPGDMPLLNGAFEVAADIPPAELLAECLEVERELGRRRDLGRDTLRTIDLDLLLYDDQVLQGPDLTLPHPRMHRRRFVLVPLAEIAPDARHPSLGRTVSELLDACGDQAWVTRWAPPSAWWKGALAV